MGDYQAALAILWMFRAFMLGACLYTLYYSITAKTDAEYQAVVTLGKGLSVSAAMYLFGEVCFRLSA